MQVEKNKAAFEWGRRCAHDLASVQALFASAKVIEFVKKPALEETIARHVAFLSGYQDAAYAAAVPRSSRDVDARACRRESPLNDHRA